MAARFHDMRSEHLSTKVNVFMRTHADFRWLCSAMHVIEGYDVTVDAMFRSHR